MSSERLPTTQSLPPVVAELPWGSRTHRTAWVAATTLLAGAGAVVGLLAVPVSEVLGIATAAATLTVLGHHLTARTSSRPAGLARLTLTVLGGTGGCVSLVGLVRLLGPFGLLLAALLVMTSPAAVRWALHGVRAVRVRGRSRRPAAQPALDRAVPLLPTSGRPAAVRPDDQPAAPAEPVPSVLSIATLSDEQLCLAWRTSFTALQRSPDLDLDRQGRLISLRQGYLDELERRNPPGFARWLYAGARPASDPTRYLVARSPRSSGTMGR